MGGGAGGHMMHPYDLPRVTSGVTFLSLMNDVKSYLENPDQASNVKIDGINTSFKLVGGEFAVDRGSGKEIDVFFTFTNIEFKEINGYFGEKQYSIDKSEIILEPLTLIGKFNMSGYSRKWLPELLHFNERFLQNQPQYIKDLLQLYKF